MFKTIEEILKSPVALSTFKGSQATKDNIASQIKAKYGSAELKNYDAYRSVMTFASWLKIGYYPKKGEKALKSTTLIEVKDATGKITKKQRSVNLFYYRQVQPLKKTI